MTTSRQIKQNAETLLVAYFLKLKLKDEKIRKKVTDLFLPAVTAVIQYIPQTSRLDVLKHLLTIIGYCVHIYQSSANSFKGGTKNKEVDRLCTDIFESMSEMVVEILKSKVTRSKKVVDRILQTVFIDDLSCDIGAKIIKYRETRSNKEKEKLKSEIELLLVDYNEVNNTNLTFKDIIKRR